MSLPTGTVTLLFTDIEASTRLVRERGSAWPALLEEHHRLLRKAFGRYRGAEVGVEGDGFFVAFDDPGCAVAGAVAAQHSLATLEGVRIRIGMHTGEPRLTELGYVGEDVHRAARIADAGHGGQVLLSEATRDLVPDATVRDLGEHRLKDLTQPQRLYQLEAEGLEQSFPPLRTLENRPTNLPVQATPLIGRGRELAAVVELVKRPAVRLVTLHGPGGCGKTRLALQAAAELVDDFPDGVYLVGLESVEDPGLVVPTIAQTLGVNETGAHGVDDALRRALGDRTVLLVLDNFEHLLPAAPRLSDLLATTDLHLVVTSRAALRLSGEYEWPVPPLSHDDAVALFSSRAQVSVTDENVGPIGEICRRLDGLPLAIELAAARVKLLSPRALQGRLGRRLQLLTGGARDLPERQQTLRATIDWSYELLEPTEQRLLGRLAVFANGCTLEAAEQVCDASLDDLASLVDKSLLGRDDDGDELRFVLLETIREYAFERLRELGEVDEVRRRHAEHYLSFAELARDELRGAGQARWLASLDKEHPNLRAATEYVRRAGDKEVELRFVSALWFFWIVHGHLTEATAAVDRALEGSTSQPVPLRADALKAGAALAHRMGDTRRAKLYAKESIDLYRELGDLGGEASALTTLGGVALVEGDGTRARQLYEQALDLARTLDDPFRLASALGNLGYLLLMEGDNDRAAHLFEEGLMVFRRLSSEEGVARSELNLAFVAWQRSTFKESEALMKDALRRFGSIGSREGIAYCIEGLAAVAVSGSDYVRAARLLGASAAVFESLELNLDPFELALHGWTVNEARRQLAGEYEAEHAAGRALSVERASQYALADDVVLAGA